MTPPKKCISSLRHESDLLDDYLQQDTHECLNYLLNTDILQEEKKQNGRLKNGSVKELQRVINQNSLVSMRFLREHSPIKLDAGAVELFVTREEDFPDLCVDMEQVSLLLLV